MIDDHALINGGIDESIGGSRDVVNGSHAAASETGLGSAELAAANGSRELSATSSTSGSDEWNRDIGSVVDTYCHNMESVHVTLPLIMRFLQDMHKNIKTDFENMRDAHGKVVEKNEQFQVISFPMTYGLRAETLTTRLRNFGTIRRLLPPTLLTTMVSQYDAFLSQLMATMFYIKPELLNGSERRLTFSELVEFGTIENARNYVIEKEIEGVMRENHSKQFDWLENKLGIKLRSDLPAWPTFIEITERRNLFTHTDGIVSSQYLDVCRRHMVDVKHTKTGKKLSVNQKYLQTAYRTLIEIGVKLAHVIWRKLNPEDREAADKNLNKICFQLLKRRDYDSAKMLLDFAVGLRKWHSELYRRMFVVNRAQAYKFGNENDKAQAILDNEDWSSCSNVFLLCVSVLRDQYDKAATIMRELGNRELKRVEYATWPIFRDFRKTSEFRQAYVDIYGEEFTISATADKVSLDIDLQPSTAHTELKEVAKLPPTQASGA